MKLNSSVKNITALNNLTAITKEDFTRVALNIFQFQHRHNPVYHQFCNALHINPASVTAINQIPFLPVAFFKTHTIATTTFEPAAVFESSGTTQTINSKHFVKDIALYEESFNTAFRLFYGDPKDWCIIALLPSYLERSNSSLIMMADKLIEQSAHAQSGFYLHDLEKLHYTITSLENQQQKTLLLGVTFALLDFAEQYPMHLQYTTIMETGGMKGRRREMTRQEVHDILCTSFKVNVVHSEYGMTELLSQAYSTGHGIFSCPPWMKVLVREEDDPLTVLSANKENIVSGAVNIIDLANIYSCSFIATDDAAKLYPDESFEILGRLDNSDIRGCSLLSL
ncbi:acyl transferase [Ferruginibacter paludis]|uniref:LuxE/PaaK family acyltransferase n=1 Tax=Ferruginibacter paludis TaxID=1310417 RepID=UPI0025B33075|nr:acyl transferase [Ferruginibacter paludis]MDN3654759.1 acyl transferase [Ferruginibacter paludis]